VTGIIKDFNNSAQIRLAKKSHHQPQEFASSPSHRIHITHSCTRTRTRTRTRTHTHTHTTPRRLSNPCNGNCSSHKYVAGNSHQIIGQKPTDAKSGLYLNVNVFSVLLIWALSSGSYRYVFSINKLIEVPLVIINLWVDYA
jgi:hypothetical protein